MTLKAYIARFLEQVRPFWGSIVIVLVGKGFEAAVGILSPLFLGMALGAIAQKRYSDAYNLVGAYIVIDLIERLVAWRRAKIDLPLHFNVDTHLSRCTLERVVQFSIGQFKSLNSAEIQDVVKKGESAVWTMLRTLLFEHLPQVMKIVFGVFMLTYIDWRLGLPLICSLGALLLFVRYVNNKFRARMKSLSRDERKVTKNYTELLRNMPLVLVSGHAKHLLDEHHKEQQGFDDTGIRLWSDYQENLSQIRSHGIALVSHTLRFVAFVFVAHGQMPLAMLVPVMSWIGSITSDLGNLQQAERNIQIWKIQATNYFDLLDMPPAVVISPNPTRLVDVRGEIRFVDVGFEYPEFSLQDVEELDGEKPKKKRDGDALVSANFTIRGGSRVAFVGPSGAGKSTIIGLILRMYDPARGAILIDGHDLTTVDLHQWYSMIGYVEQDTTMFFDMSMRYNIGLGRDIPDSKLEEVLELAQLGGVRSRLTDGWDTPVGERGVKFSGGERQRLAIARALVKDPKVIILDEATSSLDTMSERLIQKALDTACMGRTTVMIAHRLSTVIHADKIFVVDGGRISASGTHAQLQVTSPLYQELVKNQMLGLAEIAGAGIN